MPRGFTIPPSTVYNTRQSVRIYVCVCGRGGNGGKKKDICVGYIRRIIAAEVFSVPRNHKGSFE